MQVSVIIPVYNKEKTLLRAVESVLSQSFEDFELILVDDGSTDKGPEIVRSISDPRVRILSQENKGPGAARNLGVTASQADILSFLDADDEWLPGYLKTQLANLEMAGKGCAASVCGYFQVTHQGGKPADQTLMLRKRGLVEGTLKLTENFSPVKTLHYLAMMSPWSTVIRRNIFRNHGGFFEKRCLYAEDAWLWLQVLLAHKVYFSFEPLVLYHHEMSELSVSNGKPRPVEPFVTDPKPVLDAVPHHLKKLASRIIGLRALKTACVYGCYGETETARKLIRSPGNLAPVLSPMRIASHISASGLGSILWGLYAGRLRHRCLTDSPNVTDQSCRIARQ